MASAAKGKSEGLISKFTSSFRKTKAKPVTDKVAPNSKPTSSDTDKNRPVARVNWPASRLNVIEQLWGMGYTTPGGAERVKQVLPLLNLNEKKSLLLLGAGLGGICETAVEDTGVWVTGYEPDKELAILGQESMIKAGLKRKAPVRYDTLEGIASKLKPKSFDAMMALDSIHSVADKKALFEAVTSSLRMDGEMLFLSYVLPDTNPPNEKIQAWANQQCLTPHLWPVEAMMAMLNGMDLDVRPPDDISREYKSCVLKAWIGFLSNMKKEELLDKAADVVSECAHWASLITAIDRGGLKVFQFHCIKVPQKRKSVADLMASR
ncbi:MAG: class I SAM-dependent methyltransferase [Magnetovibrio sp.]|nr:class I SAM-dependent methyltransferase [Magnetovibrio sp.]